MDVSLDSNTASCSQCGQLLPYGSSFCAYCGTEQSQSIVPNALPPPDVPPQPGSEDPQLYPIAPPEPFMSWQPNTEYPTQPNMPQQYETYQNPQFNQDAFAAPVLSANLNNIGSCAKCGTMYVGRETVCMVCGEHRAFIPQFGAASTSGTQVNQFNSPYAFFAISCSIVCSIMLLLKWVNIPMIGYMGGESRLSLFEIAGYLLRSFDIFSSFARTDEAQLITFAFAALSAGCIAAHVLTVILVAAKSRQCREAGYCATILSLGIFSALQIVVIWINSEAGRYSYGYVSSVISLTEVAYIATFVAIIGCICISQLTIRRRPVYGNNAFQVDRHDQGRFVNERVVSDGYIYKASSQFAERVYIGTYNSGIVKMSNGSVCGQYLNGFVYVGQRDNVVAKYQQGIITTHDNELIGVCHKGKIYKGNVLHYDYIVGRYSGSKDGAAAAAFLLLYNELTGGADTQPSGSL